MWHGLEFISVYMSNSSHAGARGALLSTLSGDK